MPKDGFGIFPVAQFLEQNRIFAVRILKNLIVTIKQIQCVESVIIAIGQVRPPHLDTVKCSVLRIRTSQCHHSVVLVDGLIIDTNCHSTSATGHIRESHCIGRAHTECIDRIVSTGIKLKIPIFTIIHPLIKVGARPNRLRIIFYGIRTSFYFEDSSYFIVIRFTLDHKQVGSILNNPINIFSDFFVTTPKCS